MLWDARLTVSSMSRSLRIEPLLSRSAIRHSATGERLRERYRRVARHSSPGAAHFAPLARESLLSRCSASRNRTRLRLAGPRSLRLRRAGSTPAARGTSGPSLLARTPLRSPSLRCSRRCGFSSAPALSAPAWRGTRSSEATGWSIFADVHPAHRWRLPRRL